MTRQAVPLPRGGLLVSTRQGPVQFGIPPETIKDTMAAGVPDIFIVPQFMFDLSKGISLAELEFPVYFHFFFNQKKINIVCTDVQAQRLETVLKEALFGPADLEYASEFVNGSRTPGFPDLRAEMTHFRTMPVNGTVKKLALSDVARFHTFDPDGVARLKDLTVRVNQRFEYFIQDGRDPEIPIPRSHALAPDRKIDFSSREIFHPPLFGVTTLGSGHGFDPDAMTSGMIIWINRRGIMVDPPVHSSVDLVRLGVNPKVLDAIILTHCHADHDSGTLQKIMLEGKITLYTTPTIFGSFTKKASALTNISEAQLRQAVRFVPLTIGSPININGGLFHFSYTFHSIPTISFQVEFSGKTMVYSSDTHNSPAYIDTMYQMGVMNKNRRDFLKNFPWDKDLIFHEAGVPPLHTPMDYLVSLPDPVRKRTYLMHVARDLIPENSGLKIAPTGLSSTVELAVAPRHFGQSIEILSVFLDLPLFRSLPPEKTMEFLCIATPKNFNAGTPLFRTGDTGNYFYVIMSGQVDIVEDGALMTTFSRSDFFGEKCLFSDTPRTADAVARSEVRVIAIHKRDMRCFIRSTPLEQRLCHLSNFQDKTLRQILDGHPVLKDLTPSQKIQLFQIVEPSSLPANGILAREGYPMDTCYFIHLGKVRVFRKNTEIEVLGNGELLGIYDILNDHPVSENTFVADEGTQLFRFERKALETFVRNNPGVFLKLYYNQF